MSQHQKLTESSSEERRFEAEALKALETSLAQQVDALVLRNLKKEESKRRVASVIDNLCSQTSSRLSELKQRSALLDEKSRSVIAERDLVFEDLRNTDMAFSDVHRKYERASAVVVKLKEKEELLKQRDEEMLRALVTKDQSYQGFKDEARLTVEKTYADFQRKLGALEDDNVKLGAQLRRSDLRAETMSSELVQKTKENAQLNKLADELMSAKK